MEWEQSRSRNLEARASQLLETADALMERASTLASQSDQLIAALDEAARRLIASGEGVSLPPMRAPVRLVERAPEPEPPRYEPPAAPPPEPPPPPPEPEPEPPPPEPEPEPPAPAPEPEPAAEVGPEGPEPEEPEESRVSDGARLLITQMAVSGASHDEIARRLRDEFGIDDPEATLRALGI